MYKTKLKLFIMLWADLTTFQRKPVDGVCCGVAVGSIFPLSCVELTCSTLASDSTFAFCTLSCFRQDFKGFRFFIVILSAVLKLLFQVFKVHSLKTKDFAHLDFYYYFRGAAVGSWWPLWWLSLTNPKKKTQGRFWWFKTSYIFRYWCDCTCLQELSKHFRQKISNNHTFL